MNLKCIEVEFLHTILIVNYVFIFPLYQKKCVEKRVLKSHIKYGLF